MFKSDFTVTLTAMTILALGAFALVPASLLVANIVWIGGSALVAAIS